jgi:hypothetical protein
MSDELSPDDPPFVGADVHYLGPGPRLTFVNRAAKVVEVAPDGATCTLAVFNPKRLTFVPNIQHGSKHGQWHWPLPAEPLGP